MKILIPIMLVLFLSPIAAQATPGYEKSGGYERSGGYSSFKVERQGQSAAVSHRGKNTRLYSEQMLRSRESKGSWLKERSEQHGVPRQRKPLRFIRNEQLRMGGQYGIVNR